MAGENSIETLRAFPTDAIEDELDQPQSEYQVGSIVKVIDSDEHHSEWGVFEIIDRQYNDRLGRNSQSYLNEPHWYFRLASHLESTTISNSLWVTEDEICPFDISHNVSTADIF